MDQWKVDSLFLFQCRMFSISKFLHSKGDRKAMKGKVPHGASQQAFLQNNILEKIIRDVSGYFWFYLRSLVFTIISDPNIRNKFTLWIRIFQDADSEDSMLSSGHF